MAQCKQADCDRDALPLSSYCERHLAMGRRELSVKKRAGARRKYKAAKKSRAARKARAPRRAK
jgi:hypothetical protein